MRPEYIEAIDAVRYGYTLWLPFLTAGLIWYAAFSKRCGCLMSLLMFLAAWFLCWFLLVWHSDTIQDAKGRFAVTAEEGRDFTSDTWNVFAPVVAIPYALIYCLINAIVAFPLAEIGRWGLRRIARHQKPSVPTPTGNVSSAEAGE